MNSIKKRFENFELKKEKAIFIVVILLVFFGAKYFDIDLDILGAKLFVIVFSVLLLITWTVAGITVFRSLFVVGAGLTFLIFLAQSFCNVPVTSQSANVALQSLFGFGIIYVILLFYKSLFKELKKILGQLKEVNNRKNSWIIIILFGFFVGLFVWQLYQVMNPIVLNLCIYKP